MQAQNSQTYPAGNRGNARDRGPHTSKGEAVNGENRQPKPITWVPRIPRPGFTEAELEEVKRRLRAAAYTIGGVDLAHLFRYLDRNRGGTITFDEFCRGIRRGHVSKELLSDRQLKWLFNMVDVDKSGSVDLQEFIDFIGSDFDRGKWKMPKINRDDDDVDEDEYAMCLGPAWNHAAEVDRPPVSITNHAMKSELLGKERRKLAELGVFRAGAPTIGRRASLLLPPTFNPGNTKQAAKHDVMLINKRLIAKGLLPRSLQETSEGAGLSAELADRLGKLEESITRADRELEDQAEMLRHSWERSRTQADYWRRWEGYKPKSPWLVDREHPGVQPPLRFTNARSGVFTSMI